MQQLNKEERHATIGGLTQKLTSTTKQQLTATCQNLIRAHHTSYQC